MHNSGKRSSLVSKKQSEGVNENKKPQRTYKNLLNPEGSDTSSGYTIESVKSFSSNEISKAKNKLNKTALSETQSVKELKREIAA